MKKALIFSLCVIMLLVGFIVGELHFIWANSGLPKSVPSVINYQGTLSNPSNIPVPDGTYQVTFAIYSQPTGGNAIWSETHRVTTRNGYFSVLLGSVNGLTSSVFAEKDRYLGIKVGTDNEMTPRQRLATVPYAFQAENAQTLQGLSADSFIRADTTLNFNLTVTCIGSGRVEPNGGIYRNGTAVLLVASGSPGWLFDRWGGDAVGKGMPITITMNSNKNIVAYFIRDEWQRILTVNINPTGAGSVDPPSGSSHKRGTMVSLVATSNPYYVFDHWSGDASGISRFTTIVMDSDKTVTANFRLDRQGYLNMHTRFVVTRSNIQNMEQLRSLSNVYVAMNSDERQYATVAFQAENITVRPVAMSESEYLAALEKGILDAIIISSGHPFVGLQDEISTSRVNLLPFSDNAVQAVINKFPQAVASSLPANTYIGQPQAIKGYSLLQQ